MQDGRQIGEVSRASGARARLRQGAQLPPLRRHDREYDAVLGQIPRRMPLASLLQAIPGLARQFERRVPKEQITHDREQASVTCECGAVTVLEAPFVACSGGCTRWYLPVGPGAHVAGPYEPPAEAVAA